MSHEARRPEHRRGSLSPSQAMRRKAIALKDAVSLVARGRGLTPWTRPRPLTTVEYPKVFVVGCARSGTSWVVDILRRHQRVIVGPESNIFPTVHGCVGTHGRFNVSGWARLFYGIERGRLLGRDNGLHNYVDRRTLARLGSSVLAEGARDDDITARLVRAVLDSGFSSAGGTSDGVLVEKTPAHVFYAEQILSAFPDARVIEVMRDGRDVCVSMQMRGPQVPVWPMTREGQIDLWLRSVRQGLALRRDPCLRDRVTVVRYEDLKTDTTHEIARLYAAAGLDASPELVADAVAATDIRRIRTGPGERRYRGEVGTWVDHFSDEDARLFRDTVGDVFEQIGYSY